MNTKLISILEDRQIEHIPHAFVGQVHSVAEAQAETGGADHEMIKNVACVTADGTMLIVVIPGKAKVDFRALQGHTGQKVTMAKPDQVFDHTGFPVGGVPSFGISQVEYFIDEYILDSDRIFTSGGDVYSLIEMDPDDLLELETYNRGVWSK